MRSLRVDAGGQPLELRRLDWSKLFTPRTAVVVGATDTEGSPQRAPRWHDLFVMEQDAGYGTLEPMLDNLPQDGAAFEQPASERDDGHRRCGER